MFVAALYVERGGPYFSIDGVEPWDVERDARTYAGPWPVVAHPPCGPWGALKHLYKGNEHDCAPSALRCVRRHGGVLEHPARSRFFEHARLPRPGEHADAFGGFTVEIDQCAWGHVARKTTWLYIVGAKRADVMRRIRTGGTPTHWVSGFHSKSFDPDAAPSGIKICSGPQRRRTPRALGEWLVALARSTVTGVW